MRSDNLAGLAPTAIVVTILLAGCSGSSQFGSPISPISPNSQQQESGSRAPVQNAQSGSMLASTFGPNSDKAMTYISTIGGTTVYGYRSANQANHPPVCTVGPFVSVNGGIGVDQSGNLWVPDFCVNHKATTE